MYNTINGYNVHYTRWIKLVFTRVLGCMCIGGAVVYIVSRSLFWSGEHSTSVHLINPKRLFDTIIYQPKIIIHIYPNSHPISLKSYSHFFDITSYFLLNPFQSFLNLPLSKINPIYSSHSITLLKLTKISYNPLLSTINPIPYLKTIYP
jgi:hypothetical protein